MSKNEARHISPEHNGKLRPIPTVIKERVSLTHLRTKIGEKLKSISGEEIIAVNISGSESKVIVREQYLYELINLCNTLIYEKIDDRGVEISDPETRKQLLEQELKAIDELYKSEKG